MASKNFKAGIIITGDAKGGIKAIEATEKQLDGLNKSTKKSISSFKDIEKSVFSMKGALVGLTSVLAGGLFTGKVIANTIAQENAIRQLEQRLISTKGAVGIASSELQKFAASMQNVTTYGDEAILAMQGVLLTFTNIKGQAFEQTTEAVLNLSTAMGTDLKSSAVQLGKALNAPSQNLSALTRSGIQFTDAQKDLIKSLEKTGQLEKAQAVILAELETQFGGAAKAARDTLGGSLKSLSNAWNDLFENADASREMTASIEVLTKKLGSPQTQAAFKTFTAGIFDILNGFADVVTFGNQVIHMTNEISKSFLGIGELALAQKRNELFQATEKLFELEKERDDHNAKTGLSKMFAGNPEFEGQIKAQEMLIDRLKKKVEVLKMDENLMGKAVKTTDKLTRSNLKHIPTQNTLITTIKDSSVEMDDMDRALDLVINQFDALDKAEARAIAGLEPLPKKLKDVAKENKTTTQNIESDWDRLNDNIQSEFIDTFTDMLTGAEVNFKDFAKSILKMWINTTMNMAFNPQMSASNSLVAGAGQAPGTSFNPLSTANTAYNAVSGGASAALNATGYLTGIGSATGSYSAAAMSNFAIGNTAAQAAASSTVGGLTGGAGASGFMSAVGAVAPWALAALALGSAFGLFDDEALPTEFRISSNGQGDADSIKKYLSYGGARAGASSGFGDIAAGVSHIGDEGQMSEQEAAQFMAEMQTKMNALAVLDETIITALDLSESNIDAIKAAIDGRSDSENSGDLQAFLKDRYSSISDVIGGEFDQVFDLFDDLGETFNQSTVAALAYATASDEIKALYEDLYNSGHRSSESIIGLSTNLLTVNSLFESIGGTTLELSSTAAHMADNLVKAAGGMDALIQSLDYYYQNFLTKDERSDLTLQSSINTKDSINAKYGLDIQTKGDFTDFVNDLNQNGGIASLQPEELSDLTALMVALNEGWAAWDDLTKITNTSKTTKDIEEITEVIPNFSDEISNLVSSFQNAINGIKSLRQNIQNSIHGFAGTTTSIDDLRGGLTGGVDDIAIYDQIRQAIVNKYNAEIQGIQSAQQEAEMLFNSFSEISDFTKSLQLSDLSPLTNSQRLSESKNQYGQILLQAQAGDTTALSQLSGASQSYLEEARTYYASSDEYLAIWNSVNDELGLITNGKTDYTDWERTQEDLDNQLIDIQQSAVSELQSLDYEVINLQTIISTGFNSMLAAYGVSGTTINQDTSPVGYDPINAAYNDVLGRPPGEAGYDYWASTGLSGSDLVDAITKAAIANGELKTEVRALKTEVTSLRTEQAQQTDAIISTNYDANSQNAETIIDGNTARKVVVK